MTSATRLKIGRNGASIHNDGDPSQITDDGGHVKLVGTHQQTNNDDNEPFVSGGSRKAGTDI